MADVIQFPGAERYQHEEMTWHAIMTLKAQVSDQFGGKALVSAAAVHLVLIYLEHLAGRLDIIPPSGPEAA
jgi:hypothetical protein